MNRKVLLGGLAAVIFVVIMVLLSLTLVKTPKTISQVYRVSSLLNTATPYTNNSFVYMNGAAIIQYNYVTGKLTQLTPVQAQGNALADSDSLSVSPNKQYLLFHNQYASPGGVLYTTLQHDGDDPTQNYWWVYNLKTQTFTPLPSNVVLAKISNNAVYTLSPDNSISETITTYDPGTMQKTGSLNVPLASNFFAANGGYILETAKNNVLFTTNGVTSTELFTNTNIIGVTTDGKWAVATTGQNAEHPLVKINLQNNSSETVVSAGVTGPTSWNNSGLAFFTTGNPTVNSNQLTFNSYNVYTGVTSAWNLPSPYESNPPNPPLTTMAIFGPNAALMSDSQSHYYLIGTNIAKVNQKDLE